MGKNIMLERKSFPDGIWKSQWPNLLKIIVMRRLRRTELDRRAGMSTDLQKQRRGKPLRELSTAILLQEDKISFSLQQEAAEWKEHSVRIKEWIRMGPQSILVGFLGARVMTLNVFRERNGRSNKCGRREGMTIAFFTWFFKCFAWPHCTAYRISDLSFQTRNTAVPPTVEAWSPNHEGTREFLIASFRK